MKSATSERFWRLFERLDGKLQVEAREVFRQFRTDPFQRSLQFKRVHSSAPVWSVRIGFGYRALALRDEDEVTWFWIGSHADYEQALRSLR